MSMWGAFTGASGRRRAEDAYGYAQNQMAQGYEQSQGFARDADQQARGYLQPYETQGRNAFAQYGNMLGLNGGDAQRGAMSSYEQFNPYRQAATQRLMQAGDRRAAATGQFGSGLNALARARVADEGENRDYQDYMNRLQNQGGAGMGVAGQLSGLASNYGNQQIGLLNNLIQGRVGANTQYNNALASADRSGMQNVIGLGAAAAQMAMGMPPTAMGNVGREVSHQPGTASNGGWSTTANLPASNNYFSQFFGGR